MNLGAPLQPQSTTAPVAKKVIPAPIKTAIIKACIESKEAKDKKSHDLQVQIMERVFKALEDGEPISARFFTEVQAIASTDCREYQPQNSAYWERSSWGNSWTEKGFRSSAFCWGSIKFSKIEKNTLTKEGFWEILSILQKEKEQGFKSGGTTLVVKGFFDSDKPNELLRHDNLPQNWERQLDSLWDNYKDQVCHLYWPLSNHRFSNDPTYVKRYVEPAFEKLISDFNQAQTSQSEDDKLRLIINFTKAGIMLHPYSGFNNQVLVLAGLNFILLRDCNCYCPLPDREQFRLQGKEELFAAVKSNLRRLVEPSVIPALASGDFPPGAALAPAVRSAASGQEQVGAQPNQTNTGAGSSPAPTPP